MTFEIALVLLLVGGALYLFASEWIRPDITALSILVTVIAIPRIFHSESLLAHGIDLQAAFPTVEEGLSGLSNTATVTVLAMFILSTGIQQSGLIHVLGKRLFPRMPGSIARQILILGLLIGPVSGFVSNTAVVAVSIPLVLDLAHRTGGRASTLLIPLSFFGMLGGTLTLIGSSTNILASSLFGAVPEVGRRIGMFEFTLVGGGCQGSCRV